MMKEVFFRVSENLKLKLLLGTILTFGIYAGYLLIQRYLFFSPVSMEQTSLDRVIPFVPDSVYVYQSIWFLVPIAPWLMRTVKEIYRYTVGLLVICCISFTVFMVFPTIITRPESLVETNLLYQLLIQVDKELNAFPSLHVSLVLFHLLCCIKIFSEMNLRRRYKLIVWIWAMGIIFSTLLTKQHILYDVFGGILVGLLGYVIFDFENIFLAKLLPTGRVEKKIFAIHDGIVNFYAVQTTEGIVCIDAGWRESHIRKEFKRLELDVDDVVGVFLTHSHFDHSKCSHIFPAATIYSKYGGNSGARVTVRDKDSFQIHDIKIDVVETPGHSDCSVSYLLDDDFLFTGDLLQINKGKPSPFYGVLNSNNRALKGSICKIEKLQGVKCLLTSHHGITTHFSKI
ncbi:MAG: MBL fold metallo-hydrolase [Desulfobulbaceae bacterium]|nr:MBL fold metallo-hydrolase [Desulfobulbaceae bacterium]